MNSKVIGNSTVAKSHATSYQCSIELLSESGIDDNAYYPPQHISIYGEKALADLRDFCDSTIKEMKEEARKQKEGV